MKISKQFNEKKKKKLDEVTMVLLVYFTDEQ